MPMFVLERKVKARMHHRQQNKWYPQRCLLAHFEAIHSILAIVNLLAHNNISQIVTAVKFHYRVLQLTALFSDNLTPLGVTFILLAMVHIVQQCTYYSNLLSLIIAIIERSEILSSTPPPPPCCYQTKFPIFHANAIPARPIESIPSL